MENLHEEDDEKTPLLPSDQTNKTYYSPVNENSRDGAWISHDKVRVNVSHDDLSEIRQLSPPFEENQKVLPQLLNDLSVSVEPEVKKQSSLVTIFAIWNTMMGSSILAIPWALQRAGFVCGMILIVIMAGISLYTAYRIIQVQSLIGVDSLRIEFSDVCRILLGPWAEWISCFFSVSSILGAVLVYWILMSNFLYNTIEFIYKDVKSHQNHSYKFSISNDVVCPINPQNNSGSQIDNEFAEIWNLTYTPLFLMILIVPLVNFRSPTFFTKFNALGIISILFILIYVIIKASEWGLNFTFDSKYTNEYVPVFQWSFPELSGILALAYFIHNCVTSIMRNQRKMENNARDLTIAYCLVALTYSLIGITFLLSFPLPKICVADNLLNNLSSTDTLTFVARLFLLFQMTTVFPLLVYVIRIQLYSQMFHSREPSMKFILILNLLLIIIAVLFAIYYPHIGELIRYFGAFCSVAYSFALPCLTYLIALRLQGRLRTIDIAIHVVVIIIGIINFGAQFVPFN